MSTSPRKRVLPLPRPFRQGQLDGLCGPYAIINGLRSACSAARIGARVSWPMLFRVLLEQLDARWRLADVVTEGIGTQEFQFCLSTAAAYLKKRHGIHDCGVMAMEEEEVTAARSGIHPAWQKAWRGLRLAVGL